MAGHEAPRAGPEASKQHPALPNGAAHSRLKGSPAPLAYILIRWLFRFVLQVFYSSVVVEGAEHVPRDGVPCMLTANHSNSLTDALLLVTTVPPARRSLLRLTAKDTQFNRGTLTSWLIESAGTLPIKRPKDHAGQAVDNSIVFDTLIRALEKGDMAVLFPEGMSRYYPEIAPLKQGVSRIVSDTLSRQKDNPDFELAILTASITYLHRNLFRSDVLVTFHPPIYVSSRTHPDLIASPSLSKPRLNAASAAAAEPSAHERAIRSLTSLIGSSIRSGILDAPSWAVLRMANTARRLYAPLGTKLTLGDHVRLTQRFVDALAGKRAEKRWEEEAGEALREKGRAEQVWKTPMLEKGAAKSAQNGEGYFAIPTEKSDNEDGQEELEKLRRDLKTYQDLLYLHGIKDDRVRNPRMLKRRILLKRLFVRLAASVFLFSVSTPGLLLWLPIFIVAKRSSDRLIRKGPVFDTYDEVAQTKLVTGLVAGIAVLSLAAFATFPIMPLINLFVLPLIMWLTLRFLEDLTSSLRAALALARLLFLGKQQLLLLRSMRADLHARVERLSVERAGLPRDAGVFVQERERRWTRVGLGAVPGSSWLRRFAFDVGYFDVRRRRKKALKLWDTTEYADDEVLPPGVVREAQ
ncbi:hypothetical protein Rhopal_007241-T1 [Rhodotorula paludigena]|uniref:Phospholipid/glycerol acyltransferase domain-containing protein n=1 Tax=Rhodotorula paludigena TaxID=86838 RepID=A0AAV5GXV1_9BASI|nr:hypothetical protein Rhopal_007241-T1 [Rhodotorula paludigena]